MTTRSQQFQRLGFLDGQNEMLKQQIQDLKTELNGQHQLQFGNYNYGRPIPSIPTTEDMVNYRVGFQEAQNVELKQQIKELKNKLKEQQEQQQQQQQQQQNQQQQQQQQQPQQQLQLLYAKVPLGNPQNYGGQNRNGQIPQKRLKTEFNEADFKDEIFQQK